MELDELKQTWRRMDARLQRQDAFALDAWKDRRMGRARAGLRPLFWGQVVQLVFGVAVVVAGVAFWTSARGSTVLLTAGLVLHAYGVAVAIVSGMTLGSMQRIDYAAPVIAIQARLAQVRRHYVISGMVAGLPWWVLWILPPAVIAGLRGDAGALAWLVPAALVGVLGLAGTAWFHRWARKPGREALASKLDNALAGAALRRAQAALDEVRAFERE